MEVLQEIMSMIAHGGEAKSLALLAIQQARGKNFIEAEESLKKSDEALLLSHNAHTKLLVAEANEEDIHVTVLMMHAADHLGSAETVRSLAEEIIWLHKEK